MSSAGVGENVGGFVPGDVLDGRYRLLERLGSGGFGDVWRSAELLPGGAPFREVALKLLGPSAEDIGDWSEEAKILASFRHPSLVTIYAAGILRVGAGQRYVAMELLEGSTLADVLRTKKRIPWRRALAWARDVAEALDVIHARGVVHLDLKPANLFLTEDGTVKVLDFGIARRSGQGARLSALSAPPASFLSEEDLARAGTLPAAVIVTPPGGALETALFLAQGDRDVFASTFRAGGHRTVVGTPGFIAPEVLELAEPAPAADAFALGVCVALLATGALPHAVPSEPETGEVSALVAWWNALREATLRGELRDLEGDPAGLPSALVTLVRRLLAVDPNARRVTPGRLRALFDEVHARPHGVPRMPYPGPEPMTALHEGLLFGRDDEIERLGRELDESPSLVLSGGRGAGKTSLARAGLFPALAKRASDGKDDWLLVEVRTALGEPGTGEETSSASRPDGDALLDAALARAAPELSALSAREIAERAERGERGLLLFVDPVELLLGAPEGSRLLELAAPLASGEFKKGLRLLATMRDDATAKLKGSELGAHLRGAVRFLSAPAPGAAREIALGPARAAGAELKNPDLVQSDVQRELRTGEGRLAAVALALAHFYEPPGERAPKGRLDGERWRREGGVASALAASAEALLARMGPEGRAAAEAILLRLTTVEGAAVAIPESELLPKDEADDAAFRGALAELERSGVVRREGDAVTIAHEGLLAGPASLSVFKGASVDEIVFAERLREAALAWDRAGGHEQYLLRGHLYRELLRHLERRRTALGAREAEFVEACRRAARRSRLGRAFGWLLAVSALLLAVFVERVIDRRQAAVEAERRAADERAYLAAVIARARGSNDPYKRAAWIGEAVRKGSSDGMLPLELSQAALRLARAEFVTLSRLEGPAFPWDDRWLVGTGQGDFLTVVDFRSPEPDVIEGVDLDVDVEVVKRAPRPRVISLRPHPSPIAETAPFEFVAAVATRSVDGEVAVWRLADDGQVRLAARAPMRCSGALRLAKAAPVVACPTDKGIARWDLRAPERADELVFRGDVLDVSADGLRVAAVQQRRVFAWNAGARREFGFEAGFRPVLGRFGPGGALLALAAAAHVEVVSLDGEVEVAFRGDADFALRDFSWDPGGLHLAVCGDADLAAHLYLRPGGRPPSDAAPSGAPCAPVERRGAPKKLTRATLPAGFEEVETGPHDLEGAWLLPGGRVLTHDLVIFPSPSPPASGLLRFVGRQSSGEPEEATEEAVSAMARSSSGAVAASIGGRVRIYGADERRVLARPGQLLGVCSDGRFAAWRKDPSGERYVVFEVLGDAVLGEAKREPGFVLGVDGPCRHLFTQRLDGSIVATDLRGERPPRVLAVADGYVYAVRPSRGGEGVSPGLVLAASSGAVARLDESTLSLSVLAYASPRAEALSDGPAPGEVAFADASGIVIVRRTGEVDRVVEAGKGPGWEDISPGPRGKSLLLASAESLEVLDLESHEIVGGAPSGGRTHLAPWDAEGSVLAYVGDRDAPPAGIVIPRGAELVRRIVAATSNLEVDARKLVVRR